MKIGQYNLFDLIDKGTKVYHSAILTTFSFDPVFFEKYYMPQLRRRGIRNVILLVDAGRYDAVMQSEEGFAFTKKDYAIVRMDNNLGGVFHPKISLFAGKNKVMAIVGSGNLTYSGIAYNDELWGAFCIEDAQTPQAPLLKNIWEYLNKLILNSPVGETIKCQLEWMKAFSESLQKFDTIDSQAEVVANEQQLWFMQNGDGGSILDRISNIIISPVTEITIVSPFYDQDGHLIQELQKRFSPKTIKCAIQPDGGLLPHLAKLDKTYSFYHWADVRGYSSNTDEAKRLHAKAFQFKTTMGTYLLVGSCNATPAAFGISPSSTNAEAGILVYSSKGKDYLNDLGLSFNQQITSSFKTIYQDGISLPRIKRPHLKFHLLSCEVKLSQELYINADKPLNGQMVRLFYENGYKDLILTNNAVKLTDEVRAARMAVIVSGNEEISNRCIIWHLSDLETRNPDRTLDDINALFLDPEQGWDANISKVLSYVELDIVRPGSRTTKDFSTSETSVTRSKEVAVSKDHFDDISLRQSLGVDQSLSMKILDYIQFYSSETRLNADEGENSFDSDAMSSGDDVIDTSKSAAKKSLNTRNDITGYLRRLLKHYDILASDFDKSQEKYRFLTRDNDIRQGISCNNISHILIATMLVYHRMLHPKDGEDTTGLISKYLLKILGRFFMIFRNGYVGDSEYTKTKLSDMHNNLVAYALLILTMSKYAHGDKIYKLLVLNILDSYAGKKADLRSALKNYRTLRNKHKANCIKTSMEFIDDTIKLYSILEENMTISIISRFSENMLIYRSQFGYMFAKQVYEIKSAGATVLCSLPIIYTGYKEKTEIVADFPTKAKLYKLR